MPSRVVDETVSINRKKTIYTCDGCGGEGSVSLYKCFVCSKEFCPNCCMYMPDVHKIWHGNNTRCCKDCWDAGKDWREYLDDIEEEFLKMVKDEVDDWKESIVGD